MQKQLSFLPTPLKETLLFSCSVKGGMLGNCGATFARTDSEPRNFQGGFGKGKMCSSSLLSATPSCRGPTHVPWNEALCLTTHCAAGVIRPPCRRECGCLRRGKLKASKKLEKKSRRQRPILRRRTWASELTSWPSWPSSWSSWRARPPLK